MNMNLVAVPSIQDVIKWVYDLLGISNQVECGITVVQGDQLTFPSLSEVFWCIMGNEESDVWICIYLIPVGFNSNKQSILPVLELLMSEPGNENFLGDIGFLQIHQINFKDYGHFRRNHFSIQMRYDYRYMWYTFYLRVVIDVWNSQIRDRYIC